MADPPIHVLVADDHPVVRAGLSLILQTEPDIAVVGEAEDGPQALQLARDLAPAVLLLDLEMPGMDGVEVIRRLKLEQPAVAVVVFTAFDTDERIITALQAGACGYLLKGAPREELFAAVRAASTGGAPLAPVVAGRLLRHVRGESEAPREQSLTQRQLEVLRLAARGLQNKEIAAALHISERTAKFHVEAVLARLGAANRTEAAAIAVRRHLLDG